MRKSAIMIVVATTLLIICMHIANLDQEATFEGTDAQALELITNQHPEYQPWFKPLWTPPSASVESLLFSLQTALGGGVLGYCLGMLRTHRKRHVIS